LFFDVTLYNKLAEPRWFLLPDKITPNQAQPYAVATLEVYKLGDQGEVVVGHFSGSRGFQALLLPPGGQVQLQRFPIPLWGKPPASVMIEVVNARSLTVGDEPAEAWFGMNPMSTGQVTVLAEALATQRDVILARHTPDRSEVTVTVVADSRIQLQVDLGGNSD
jgi:hypothetical protein